MITYDLSNLQLIDFFFAHYHLVIEIEKLKLK